jgi:hypothetical protein
MLFIILSGIAIDYLLFDGNTLLRPLGFEEQVNIMNDVITNMNKDVKMYLTFTIFCALIGIITMIFYKYFI